MKEIDEYINAPSSPPFLLNEQRPVGKLITLKRETVETTEEENIQAVQSDADHSGLPKVRFHSELGKRQFKANLFKGALALSVISAVVMLFFLLMEVALTGIHWLDWQFVSSFPSRFPHKAGIYSALMGTLWIIGFTALFSIPVGIGAAVYLEEYAKPGKLSAFIEINIANLAGVPSIIYGLLGLTVFVRFFAMGRSILAGSLTMGLLILPIIIVASRESLKGVPQSIRHAAYALGATKWQTIRAHVLPMAFPSILTGVILAISRAIGETAPLILIGAVTYIAFVPQGPMDSFTVLPIQIYDWTSRPQEAFHELAASGIMVLLAVLITLNSIAIYIRNSKQRKNSW